MKQEGTCNTKCLQLWDKIKNHRASIPLALLVSLILIMVTERLYYKSLYEASFEAIANANKNMPDFALQTFTMFSETGGGKTIALYTILCSLFVDQRKKFVYFTLLITMIILVMNSCKMLYKENRPQWERNDLTVTNEIECSMEYGNPSGHSMIAGTMASAIFFDLIIQNRSRTRNVRIAYGILHAFIALFYIAVMGFSRIIIAVHAWNQVIFGWLLGIWLATFLQLIVRPPLDDFIEIHLNGTDTTNFCMKTIMVLVMMLVCVGIQLGAFGLAKTYGVQMDQADDENPIIEKGLELCAEFDKTVAFNNHSLVQIGLCGPFFGAVIGVLLQSKCFHGQRDKERRIELPAKNTFIKGLGRFVVCVLISLPWIGLVKLLDFGGNQWLNMIRYLVPFFGWNLTLAFILDIICSKLGLYDQKTDAKAVTNTAKAVYNDAQKSVQTAINRRE